MPKGNRVKITKNKLGQYRMTIPKSLGDAMDLAGAVVEVSVGGRDTLTIRVVKRENE